VDLIDAGMPDDRSERLPALLTALLDNTDVLLVDQPDGLTSGDLFRQRSAASTGRPYPAGCTS
jgi:hypothetical protein